jgi:bifunctional DNase/RNase
VALDPRSNSPVLVLEELEGPRRLPIWIGMSEARSIASVLEDQRQPRPNTHDLGLRYDAPLFVREAVFESTVEGQMGTGPGKEVRNVPARRQLEFHRQVTSSKLRIQSTNAS